MEKSCILKSKPTGNAHLSISPGNALRCLLQTAIPAEPTPRGVAVLTDANRGIFLSELEQKQ